MTELNAILNELTESLVEKIQNNLSSSGTNATGRTSAGLEFKINEEGSVTTIEVLANPFTGVVETGRKETPDKKPSAGMIENLKEWTAARGIDEKAVWGIATNINKEGTKLYQKGGRTDIYTEPFNEYLKTLQGGILEGVVTEFTSIINGTKHY